MTSLWSESVRNAAPRFPSLSGKVTADVLIIGAGMAGILTAHKLKEAGIRCIVAEGATIGSGITKNTTAKITAQHGLIYADLIRTLGRGKARLHYDANTKAIRDFEELSKTHPCDFEEQTAYVYSRADRKKLEREAKAYQRLGIQMRFNEQPPLPMKTVGALGMKRQAHFNPLKFLYSLAESLEIYENSFIYKLDKYIDAKHVVLATHYPLVNIPGGYFIKLYQHRSYVIAVEGATPVDGMYVDENKEGHSFRMYDDLLLIGGGGHKTGKKGKCFKELRHLAARSYPNAVERYSWAAQDCMSLDGLPYIGRHSRGKRNLYVATGFNKWGMTGSMVAANVLRDLILHGSSEFEELYSPQRSILYPQLAENVLNAAAGLLSIGGPRCSHMGCKLHFNKLEGTWDCACHGSRFTRNGHVIDNPAKRPIRPR